ncbi:protein kinase [Gemmatimonas sp.]|jgi:tetratricopeptide (TPR) repeat protein/tRNA A-37 threonylcarbamoyl transferase component Bud32|uniref:protein kinase domain-containing protein n=1 Tax=Gemmatimonas sp. TaxID=1962908 RepID=UPI0037BFA1A8
MDPFRSRLEQALSGQYRFIRELGGGGMSRSYLADEPALQRRVVVKVLSPEMLEGLSVERFKREVLMAASLQHPHVVPVLAAGDADGLPWFSMPYVDGDSLRQRLVQGPLAIGEAVAILRDVARALSYAHGHGIVHRDIKPDNVLLSAGSATVTDFGIAKAISASRMSASGATLTQVGLAIGTPAYMAPEQAEGAGDIDHRADLYAYGAMAFELLTGQALFTAATPGRLLVSQMTEAPRDPRLLRPDIPAPLAELVLRCLAKMPADRPADAAAIVRALEGTGSMAGGAMGSDGALRAAMPVVPLPTVLGTWAGGALLLVGGVYAAGKTIGVPSWAMPSAVTLAAAGLPALLGAWWVQRTAQRAITRTPTLTPGGTMAAPGTMATLALRARPHVTLRRTRRLGVIAASLFALLVGGFVASRAYGIGPAASLMSAGEFGAREKVLVADFRPPANDSALGATVAEALRTDLAQSPNLSVLTRAAVREVLQRMQRPAEALVPFELAREIATREGSKAVIDGDVVRLGGSYVLSARLVAAIDGRELAAFRETAENDAELVPAVGKLSRSIREKVGESLKGLGEARALERVSTPSLAALRKYVEGMRLEEDGGDRALALQRLQDAVAIDSAFSMAWRKIAVMYTLLPNARAQAIDAVSRAYRFRDRLSDDERDLTDAAYFSYGPSPDPDKATAAYEQLLARDSLNSTALNNLGVMYTSNRQYEKALVMYLRAASLPRPATVSVINLAAVGSRRRNTAAVDSAAKLFALRFPGSRQQWEVTAYQLYGQGKFDSLAALARRWVDSAQSPRQLVASGNYQSSYEASRGRIGASLAASAARDEGLARVTKRPPQLLALLVDSARAAGLYDGDRPRAHGALQRLLSPAVMATAAPADRPWFAASVVAALAGDAAAADALLAAYRRDNAVVARDPAWEGARVAGHIALAKGQYREAIAQLQQAARRKTAADPEEAFLIAMAFDRAGAPDSAITWFNTMLDPKELGMAEQLSYRAAAEKRLAELLDAKGDAAGAITHYEQFATLWKDAEPSRQPVVKAARDRAAQLRGKKDPG